MKFRKKPVVIEAVRASDVLIPLEHRLLDRLPPWMKDAHIAGDVFAVCGQIRIKTLEGVMEAREGDWIIRGVKGEIYPCKPDIFEATYERFEDRPPAPPRTKHPREFA